MMDFDDLRHFVAAEERDEVLISQHMHELIDKWGLDPLSWREQINTLVQKRRAASKGNFTVEIAIRHLIENGPKVT